MISAKKCQNLLFSHFTYNCILHTIAYLHGEDVHANDTRMVKMYMQHGEGVHANDTLWHGEVVKHGMVKQMILHGEVVHANEN